MHLLPSMMPEFDPQESWSDSSYKLSFEHKNTQKKKYIFKLGGGRFYYHTGLEL